MIFSERITVAAMLRTAWESQINRTRGITNNTPMKIMYIVHSDDYTVCGSQMLLNHGFCCSKTLSVVDYF